MKTYYVLFETDQWQSHDDRVLLGVFSSEEKAKKAADRNRIPYPIIIECILNKFEEQ